MRIIDDWLRQHPKLTLTRDQHDDLEQLIGEEVDDFAMERYRDDDFDEDAFAAKCFRLGAMAMRENVVKLFADAADNCGKLIGLGNALAVLSDDLEKIELPETPDNINEED